MKVGDINKSISSWRPTSKFGLSIVIALSVITVMPLAKAVTLFSQGFFTNNAIPSGSIVSLEKNSSDHVEVTTTDNATSILGVVVDSANSQLSVSSGQKSQVQVATSGLAKVLVSDINGKILAGDPITASPIAGVGMKATSNVKVVGIAQEAFPNSTQSQQSYTDQKKQKHNVLVGETPVQVSVSYFYKQPDKTLIPSALQNIANALAGKTVNTVPILISMGIFLIMIITVVSIIYAMIHSSIISVGRNPMSQAAVYRNVVQLSTIVVVIIAVSIVAIYLVLAKF